MNNPAWIYRKQQWIYLEQWRDQWREWIYQWNGAAGGHETGSQAELARMRGGRGRSLRAGPAACGRGRGAGPLPARAGGVRSWRAVGTVGPVPCPRGPAACGRCAVAGGASARGRRRAVRGTGRRVLASDGRERLEGEREA